MRSFLCAFAATLALVAGAARADDGDQDGYDKIRERGTLEVAVYSEFPPFSYEKDGQAAGLDVDLAAALAKAVGLKLKLRSIIDGEDTDDDLRNFVWKGSVLGGGTVDLMMHVGADEQYVKRQDKVLIFGVYLHEAISIALRESRIKNFNALDQLKSRKTAVELGSISDLYLSDAFGGLLRESLVRKPSTDAAVKAFVKDEVDAVIAPRGELQGLLKLHGAKDFAPKPIQFGGLFRSAWDVGMAVKATTPKLKAALYDALVKMENSGELAGIYARYGLDYARPQSAASTGAP
ncbi:MAG: transporter substrate-binding domain-containing protein [Nevskia sp.]